MKKTDIESYTDDEKESREYLTKDITYDEKKSMAKRSKEILLFALAVVFVCVSIIFIINFKEGGFRNATKFNSSTVKSLKKDADEKQAEKEKICTMDSVSAPWFVIDESGLLNFYPDKFSGSSLVIPAVYDDVAVKSIGGVSFGESNSTINDLTISEGVKVVEDGAFNNFTALKTVSIPSTVIRIRGEAFKNTPWYKSLTDEFSVMGDGVLFKYSGTDSTIAIPESVKYLDGEVFKDVKTASTIVVPNTAVYIGVKVFMNCTAENIVFPDNIQFVENDSFVNCKWLSLQEDDFTVIGDGCMISYTISGNMIRIPENVKQISGLDLNVDDKGKDVTLVIGANVKRVADVTALGYVKTIKVDEANRSFRSRSGVFFSRDKKILYRYPVYKTKESYYLPEETLKIGTEAFSGTNLKTIEMYDGLLSINASAFENCRNLESIEIPDSVTMVGGNIFKGCISLRSAIISEKILSIPYGFFSNCTSLKSVVLPEKTKTINDYAFGNCLSLKGIYITKSVSVVKAKAFDGCTNIDYTIDKTNPYYEVQNGVLVRKIAKSSDSSEASRGKEAFS